MPLAIRSNMLPGNKDGDSFVIAIIDYDAGNLTSVKLAFDTVGAATVITRAPAEIRSADRVVFPGVGAAGSAMANLKKLRLVEAITETATSGTPILGICLGTQVILDHSLEDGGVDCMGLIPGTVEPFEAAPPLVKVPQMGWNSVRATRAHAIFEGIEDDSEFYFVHSYYPSPADPGSVLGRTDYAGVTFASVISRGNVVATQFHPEKSGRIGLRMLENFSRWDGSC